MDPDLPVTRMAEEIGIANTFAWSPDGTRLYFADTLTGWIFVYDFDLEPGMLGERRNFAPDGATDRIVKVPAAKVTSCAFGGPDLDILYITTARYEATEDDLRRQPQAGSLFAVRPGVQGLPRALRWIVTRRPNARQPTRPTCR